MLKTLNEWLKQYGYRWAEGREELYKAVMPETQAYELMRYLYDQGAIKRV